MTDPTTSPEPKPSFEKALEALQQTVKRLESGELTLEQALKHFEDGVRMARSCQEYLSDAEKKVEILTRISADGTPQTEPFKE
jgi:exodeoxyribonuclease VII small subunit